MDLKKLRIRFQKVHIYRLDSISDDNSSQGSSEDYNAVIDAALKLLTGEENSTNGKQRLLRGVS